MDKITPLNHPQTPKAAGHNLDGFFARGPAKMTATAKTKITPKVHAAHHAVRHIARHKTQKAKTLMRHAVTRPAGKNHITAQATVLGAPAAPDLSAASIPFKTVLPQRFHRAQKVHQSSFISKFSSGLSPALIKKMAPLAVKPSPAHPRTAAAHQKPDPFASALTGATAHQHKPLKKHSLRHRLAHRLGTSSKVVSALAGGLAVLLLSAFIAYQNVPNFAMRVAATRAGFPASLPGYQPAGFGLRTPIHYSPGQITVDFKSNSDNRSFKLVQRSTNLNNEALLNSVVASNHQSYQTYQDKGKTIYIYNGTNATWVNGGVLYQIESNASLNSDQLLKIANSL